MLKILMMSLLAMSTAAEARSVDKSSGRLVEVARCQLERSTNTRDCVKLQLPQNVSCELEIKNPNQREQQALIKIQGLNINRKIRRGGFLMQQQFERHSLFRMNNGKEEIHVVWRRDELSTPYELTEVNFNREISSGENMLSWTQYSCQL